MKRSPVAIADGLAEELISAVPYRLAAARSDSEREAAFRLRYRTVVDMGWATPEDLPDDIERDEDDERSTHVCAWHGDELVGTSRVVLPLEGRPLPLEAELGLALDSEGVVEVGRLVIVPRLRGDSRHLLLVALFAQSWLEMTARGFTDLVSAAPRRLLDIYRSLGFTVIELGEARDHWGEERLPVRFDVIGSVPRLRRVLGAGDEAQPAPTLPRS
jgi:N-acyl-L-homoserine lactone synthetase